MKVGILTWYKELNHGAVLQAYASQEFLKQNGYSPVIVDYERKTSNNLGALESTRKRLKRLFSGDYKYNGDYEKYKTIKKQCFSNFSESAFDHISSISDQYDCIMIGSDMVFSLIQGFSPYMFGIGIDSKYIFSYAACSGGTKYKLVARLGLIQQIENGLSRFNSLGCRDEETQLFVKQFLPSANPVLNIDPVLLYGFDKEKHNWNSRENKSSKYLLVYSYHGDMNSKQEISEIRKYAKSHNLRIVSVGYFHPWCDENINGDPKIFFDLFLNADVIITDTFHGTVFSIILNKRFCSIIRGNAFKLHHLLVSSGLDSRIANNPCEIAPILELPIDYSTCSEWLTEHRTQSKKYILENLEIASKNY